MSNPTHQRPRKSLSQFDGVGTNATLRSGPQEKYIVLPTGQWVGGIHKQNVAKHTEKKKSMRIERIGTPNYTMCYGHTALATRQVSNPRLSD